ncbi:MAG: ABC transporter ATP-binding protein [Deltaproteobacteria bacterium]|nr:ABC transporter ATP-binding protein [Deltaproteobacteria bacterium]
MNTENLNKKFGGVSAVFDTTIQVEDKKLTAIIGPNGAGKTTFFNLVTGRLRPTSGKVFYKGHDITHSSPHKLAQIGICRTFQINSLFLGLTVFENVRLAKQAKVGGSYKVFSLRKNLKDVNEGARTVLEEVGLQDKGSVIVSKLSYGDQRALELGIALACEPKVMLLDEPTAGMSQGETERLTNLIKELANSRAIVLVEHDVEMVMAISDNISVMNQGKIIAEGPPEEIRKNHLVREAYLGEED